MGVFSDPHRLTIFDPAHSDVEDRWFCVGKAGSKIITVRFTMRENKIRIIGAALWRKWRKIYEKRS